MKMTVYEYNQKELFKDADDAYTVEEIQRHYANHFPELNNATYTVIPPQNGAPRKVIFAKKVGTKG
jgi:PRTRC genetic system protein C